MGKKKLLYILHNVQLGGAEVALVSAIPKLHENFEIKVLALGKVQQKQIGHLTEAQQAVFHSLDYKFHLFPVQVFKAIQFALAFNPDIVITSFWRSAFVGALLKRLRRHISYYTFIHSSAFSHRLDEIFSTFGIHNADKILVDSHATAQFIKGRFNPKSPVEIISFLTNPSPDNFDLQPVDKSDVRFIFLGRLNRVKNLHLAVKTIAELRAQNVNAWLDIYGKDDGEKSFAEEQLKTLGLTEYVQFKGELYSSDKAALFRNYHFLIQLSQREGMAMSVAEAMQNGVVCIVTPVGEIPNYATDLKTAVFFDTNNWNESLDKIQHVINECELYKSISSASYETFRHKKVYADSLIEKLSEKPGVYDLIAT